MNKFMQEAINEALASLADGSVGKAGKPTRRTFIIRNSAWVLFIEV